MWILFLIYAITGSRLNTKYSEYDEVTLWFNKLVPYDNPQESYPYSYIPSCKGTATPKLYSPSLGEAIEGYDLEDSGIDIKFKVQTSGKELCVLNLNDDQRIKLKEAVQRSFRIQMFFDDLPIWNGIGDYDEISEIFYIYTHFSFVISYNKDQIIFVKSSLTKPVNLEDLESIRFSYSVSWVSTDANYGSRFRYYLDSDFFENGIHWLSLVNSLVMVLLLCILVLLILYRTISKDYDRYNSQDIDSIEFPESKGWKQVAGDVFGTPESLPLFTSMVSIGWHLFYLTVLVIFTCILQPIYMERGALSYYTLIEYTLLGFIGGFQCGSIYTEYKGKIFIVTAVFTSLVLPYIFIGLGLFLNLVSFYYSSTVTPFIAIIQIAGLLIFVYLPLFCAGLIIGRRYQLKRPISHRINSVKSPILREKKIYNHPFVLIFSGGILPFSSIFVELYYLFTSVWNYKFYYVYGFTLIIFVLFVLSVCCVSIVVTYSTLNSEDYRWQWVSFLSPASCGLYLFAYSIYYYFFKSSMYGALQFTFYFSYMIIISIFISLVGGALGYTSSYYFVKRIYSNIKSE